MTIRRNLLISFFFICLALSNSQVYAAEKLESVTLQLTWKNQFQFAGYYVAKELGFYNDVGLDVTIKEYESGTDVTQDVLSQKAHFGVGRSALVLESMEGKEVYLLSAIFQHSPLMLLAKKRSDLKQVSDLKGKRIMMTDDVVGKASLTAMLLANGIKSDSYTLQEHTFNTDDLISGKTDAVAAYISNEPHQMEKRGIDYTIFAPKDHRFDFYSDILFTSQKLYNDNPKLVKRFYQASLQGWAYAFSHIDEAVDLILKKYNTQNRRKDALLFEANTLKTLAYDKGVPLGNINKSRIAQIAQVYRLIGLTHQPLKTDNLILEDTPSVALTPEEKAWLDKHPVVRARIGKAPPLHFFDGKSRGISVDYLNLIAKRAGFTVQYVTDIPWSKALEDIKNHETIDLLLTAKVTPERRKYMAFTKDYLLMPWVIFTQKDKSIGSMEDLMDKTVAVERDYVMHKKLAAEYPDMKLLVKGTSQEAIEAVATGEADAYIGNLTTGVYIIRQNNLNNIKVAASTPFGNHDQAMAIRDDWPELAGIIDKGLSAISEKERNEILTRYLGILSIEGSKTAQTQVALTPQEKAWLAEHPEIQVGIMNAWPPMNFVDAQGNPQGIGVDYIKALNKRLNGALTIVPRPFKESVDLVKNKKLDALMDITPKKEREPFLNFTKPYMTIPHVIVGRKDGPYFKSEKDLAGKTIALERGFYNVKFFRKNYPEVTIKEYDSTSDALDAVSRGRADAYAGNRAVAMYLIEKELLANLIIQGRQHKPPVVLSIGVRKDWPVLAELLDRALASITREEVRRINLKWFKEIESVIADVILTQEERAWLTDHPVIHVAMDPTWAPVEFADDQGRFHGISMEYLHRLSELLDVSFEVAGGLTWQEAVDAVGSGELDLLSSMSRTPEREARLNFTNSYLSMPINIFAGGNVTYIGGLKALEGKRVAVVERYAIHEWLRDNHPGIQLVPAETIPTALKMLAKGEVYAFVGNMVTTSHYISKLRLKQIRVAGETPYINDQTMAVRQDWPILAGILQKALDAIPQNERDTIFNRWVSVKYEHGFDYSLLWKVLAPAFLVVMLFFYWNRRLSREVARRKLAENMMRKSEAQLSDAADIARMAYWELDLQALVFTFSDSFFALLETTAEKAGGNKMPVERYLQEIVHPDDRWMIQELIQKALQATEDFRAERFDYRVLKRDGEIQYALVDYRIILNNQGKPSNAYGSHTDITERKQAEKAMVEAEERTRLLLESAGEGIFGVDFEKKIVFANQATRRMLGYTADDLIGLDAHETIHYNYADGTAYPKEKCPMFAAIPGRAQHVYDEVLWRKDGTSFSVEYTSTPINKDGKAVGAVVTFKDITEQKQMEKSLKMRIVELADARLASLNMMEDIEESRKKAEDATQAKSDFLASMSHELRTPLNAIIGFSEVLRDQYFGEINEKQAEYTNDILESGKHLLSLINDILDLSKVEAGKMELDLSQVNIKELLESSLVMIKEKALKHRIALDLNIPEELSGLEIQADERKVKQVMFNLLSNAAKFTPDGGEIRVTVDLISELGIRILELKEDEKQLAIQNPKSKIEVGVADNGIGLSPENQEKIFQEFYQVRGGTTDKTPGTGLGLPLTKSFVEMHGGRIWVESKGEGKGSRFSFLLPIKSEDLEIDAGLLNNPRSLASSYEKHKRPFTLCYLQIDREHFKEEAPRIREAFVKEKRGDDFLVMDKGGDVYLVIQGTDREKIKVACNRLIKKMKSMFEGLEISYSTATFPEDGDTPEAIIKKVRKT